jgi:TPR repeat protein
MAEPAHDASGPALSEPAGTAQQASGPDPSDKGKLRVFISYSRDDLKFADQLDAALNACGFECLIDRHGISGGEDWKRRLGNLIREAETVVFVLSPSSARSEICDWEVEEAARLNKRILPVNCRPLEGVSPPPRLRDLNYMFFCEEPKMPGSGFGTGLASLIAALNTDLDWLREHTRYLQRAIEWDKGGRPANRLLSGNDILDAKAWAARRPKSAPEPTALQLDFIRASEEEAAARLSEQRKQLETVAAAQAEREKALHEAEEALKKAADAQRRRTRVRNIAFVVVSGLAAVAFLLAGVAVLFRLQEEDLLARGSIIIMDVFDRMDIETEKEAIALFETGVKYGHVASMSNLGWLYENGKGVPQDYAKARELYEKAAAKGNEDAKQRLERLSISEARATGRYAEALRHGEALVAIVEAVETKRDGKPGEQTAWALQSVAWSALFAQEFPKALAASVRGSALLSHNLSIEPIRAHVLLFMERGDEAKALYLAHQGQPLSETDNRLWERIITDHFAELRKAGLTHPMMADIEKELGVSPDGNSDIGQR